jgi:flagellar protein FliS
MLKRDYLENQITTATPAKLVEMLYTGAIHFLETAIRAMDNKDFDLAHAKTTRVQDIVMELNVCLDLEKGGEIAQSLRSLYLYMYDQLIKANTKKDSALVAEVQKLLIDLKDTWVQAMKDQGSLAEKLPNPNQSRLNVAI